VSDDREDRLGRLQVAIAALTTKIAGVTRPLRLAGGRSSTLYCSFCGKSQHEVDKLVAGPSIFICNECTDPTGSSTATSRHEQKPAKSRLMVPLAVLCGVMMAFLAGVWD